MGWAAAKPIIFRRNDAIDEKTQAALSQIGREEKTSAADKVSPIVRHRASIAQPVGWVERSEIHPVGGSILERRWVSLRSTHPTLAEGNGLCGACHRAGHF